MGLSYKWTLIKIMRLLLLIWKVTNPIGRVGGSCLSFPWEWEGPSWLFSGDPAGPTVASGCVRFVGSWGKSGSPLGASCAVAGAFRRLRRRLRGAWRSLAAVFQATGCPRFFFAEALRTLVLHPLLDPLGRPLVAWPGFGAVLCLFSIIVKLLVGN